MDWVCTYLLIVGHPASMFWSTSELEDAFCIGLQDQMTHTSVVNHSVHGSISIHCYDACRIVTQHSDYWKKTCNHCVAMDYSMIAEEHSFVVGMVTKYWDYSHWIGMMTD